MLILTLRRDINFCLHGKNFRLYYVARYCRRLNIADQVTFARSTGKHTGSFLSHVPHGSVSANSCKCFEYYSGP